MRIEEEDDISIYNDLDQIHEDLKGQRLSSQPKRVKTLKEYTSCELSNKAIKKNEKGTFKSYFINRPAFKNSSRNKKFTNSSVLDNKKFSRESERNSSA